MLGEPEEGRCCSTQRPEEGGVRAELSSGSLAQVADNESFFNSMSPELPVLLCLLEDTQPHAYRKRNVPRVQARAGVILALGAA